MRHEPLRTYLRTYRRRTCLSQDDVAFLLGSLDGGIVSRHERGHRTPVLAGLLGYSLVFNASLHQLYEGTSRNVQAIVCKRARGLLRSLERQPHTPVRQRKIAVLGRIISQAQGQ